MSDTALRLIAGALILSATGCAILVGVMLAKAFRR